MTAFLQFIQKDNILKSLLFLLVVFLPTQLGKHFWPSFAFINGIRVDYLSPTFYLTDFLAISFIVASFVFYKRKIFPPKQMLFVYLFLAIGIFLSVNPLAGWYYLLKFTEFLFLGFAVKNYFVFSRAKLWLWIPLTISLIFESVLGIWQYFAQSSIGGIFYFFGERTFTSQTPGIANASLQGQLILRPYATFPHPNVFAGFLCLSMMFLALLWNTLQIRIQKVVFICVFCLGTVMLVLTLSRTAIFLWIIFLATLVIKKNSLRKIFFFPVVVVIGISILVIPFLHVRFFDISFFSETIQERILLLQNAWKMIATHPVLGVGFANFFNELPVSQPGMQAQIVLIQPVHNVFFLIAAETGIAGLIGVLWFCYQTYQRAKILDKNANRKEKAPIIVTAWLFFGMLFLGQFDHYLLTLQQGQLLATIIVAFIWSNQKNKHGTIVV